MLINVKSSFSSLTKQSTMKYPTNLLIITTSIEVSWCFSEQMGLIYK